MNLVETILKNIEMNYPRLFVDSKTEDTITFLIDGNGVGYQDLKQINIACMGNIRDLQTSFNLDNDCTYVEVEVDENYDIFNLYGRNDDLGVYNLPYSVKDVDNCIEDYKESGVLNEDFEISYEEKMNILSAVLDNEYVNEVIKNDIYDALEHHPKNEIVS